MKISPITNLRNARPKGFVQNDKHLYCQGNKFSLMPRRPEKESFFSKVLKFFKAMYYANKF